MIPVGQLISDVNERIAYSKLGVNEQFTEWSTQLCIVFLTTNKWTVCFFYSWFLNTGKPQKSAACKFGSRSSYAGGGEAWTAIELTFFGYPPAYIKLAYQGRPS